MSKYAEGTTVSVEKSQEEIKKLLRKYEAKKFGFMEDPDSAHVLFEYNSMMIRMSIVMPDRKEFITTQNGRSRSESIIDSAYDTATKQRWRALLLVIKAKLEAVESGIATIEQEFLAYIQMPDGRPLGDHFIPKLKEISISGRMPRMLEFSSGA